MNASDELSNGASVRARCEIRFSNGRASIPAGTRGTILGDPGIVVLSVLFDGHDGRCQVDRREIELDGPVHPPRRESERPSCGCQGDGCCETCATPGVVVREPYSAPEPADLPSVVRFTQPDDIPRAL